jgi:hypothetical protein
MIHSCLPQWAIDFVKAKELDQADNSTTSPLHLELNESVFK